MDQKEAVMQEASKYRVRCLSIYRRLRFDVQEMDVSPEIRNGALALEKAVGAGDYAAAGELNKKMVYLVETMHERRLVSDLVLQNLKNEAERFSKALEGAEG